MTCRNMNIKHANHQFSLPSGQNLNVNTRVNVGGPRNYVASRTYTVTDLELVDF